MKKRSNKKNRFKAGTNPQQIKRRVIEMKPEELAVYIHKAEKEVLPTIKEMELSAGTAIILVAQYTRAFITGNPRVTLESTMNMTESVLALWETGFYQPGPQYPFTLEETRLDLKNGIQPKEDYSAYFQPFTPIAPSIPRGTGQVAGGIVQHPKTHLWQPWMLLDGPCEFLGAYHDSHAAQKMLEEIINAMRQGAPEIAQSLYQPIISSGGEEPQQIPHDMILYLLDHQGSYKIDL